MKSKDIKPSLSFEPVNSNEVWINPIGGLGDTLMLSGVLKLAYEVNPNQKYNLVRRAGYQNLLRNHPAIKKVGFAPLGATIIGTDYWSKEELGAGNQRAFQILARMFGLNTPVEEKIFLPDDDNENDDELYKIIPWKQKNVVIAPSSDSPRKMLHPMAWHHITERLTSKNSLVLQVGRPNELHIKGAYSLLGLTTPRQLIALLKKCQLVVTCDNFIMHAAHFVGIPAVVVWGPTNAQVYGYAEQIHFQGPVEHCEFKNKCIGPGLSQNYATPCPLGPEQCLNKIPLQEILTAIDEII